MALNLLNVIFWVVASLCLRKPQNRLAFSPWPWIRTLSDWNAAEVLQVIAVLMAFNLLHANHDMARHILVLSLDSQRAD